MDIAYVDNLSYNGRSFLHSASAPSKMLLVGLVLSAVIVSRTPLGPAVGLVVVIGGMLAAGIPLRRALGAAAYAVVFSSIFAISVYRGDPAFALAVLLKGSLSAITAILLISTTPYVDIFSVLRRFLPALLIDMLFITYRSFFMILAQTERFFTTLRLRGDYTARRALRHFKDIGRMIGHNLIHAWEMGERMEQVMSVRGYESGLIGDRPWPAATRYDAIPLAMGAFILLVALVAR